ncbi:dual specificity protein phosphatase 22 [Carlito syrichta]|uniref:JNK pathway associated phosphatase n=1 Tax=Carlito syrichta TaxID=1868482 RepID=A0A3Q0DVR2_CARSF|nr:dual specificity protein phosphatase 22 [Carlito syrichta]
MAVLAYPELHCLAAGMPCFQKPGLGERCLETDKKVATTASRQSSNLASSKRDCPPTGTSSPVPRLSAYVQFCCGYLGSSKESYGEPASSFSFYLSILFFIILQGVKYLCIPAADSPSQNLTRHFKESIKFIHECRLRGEGCLVHCLAGVSRSVTLVIAYIMTVTDFGWEDALHTVRAGRSCANPNLGFQRQLQEFEKHEVHQYRQWLKEEYGESPLRDAEEAKNILAAPGIVKYWAFLRRL